MFVILAQTRDAAAAALAERWCARGGNAGVLTGEDLTRPGWRHEPGARGAGSAVVGGRTIQTGEIHAVLTRVVAITANDLPSIHPQDVVYAAAEGHAFLVAWLASLPCPVVNRPTPACLAGPAWSAEQWGRRARRLGIPVAAMVRSVPEQVRPVEPTLAIDIVGADCFAGGEPAGETPHGRLALTLARDASVDLLRVTFTGDPERETELRFAGASPIIDLTAPAVADAVLDLCMGAPRPLRRIEASAVLA
jgi:hypothetical protein